MKLYNDYTKEPYLFLVNDITLSRDNLLQFRKNLLQKWILVRKLNQSVTKSRKKGSIRLRQTAKISALSSGNISEYEFLTGKYVLWEKEFNQKIWLFSVRQRTKSKNWHCEKAVSKIRQYWWVW